MVFFRNKLIRAAGVSVSLHLALWLTALWFLKISEPKEILTELDFSVPAFRAPARPRAAKAPPAAKKTSESVPSENPKALPDRDEKNEPRDAPRENPQPENGNGDYEGPYIPASSAARGPRWIDNRITSRDYPLVARQEGKDGLVVLELRITSDGKVKDAVLLRGSYEILNNVALEKAKKAVFTPAYDASGRPVPCKVKLPIRFRLRN